MLIRQGDPQILGQMTGSKAAIDQPDSARSIIRSHEAVIDADLLGVADNADEDDMDSLIDDEHADEAPSEELRNWQSLFDEEDKRAYRDVIELVKELGQVDSQQRQEARQELRARHRFHRFERIVGDNNLFEINYLARGQFASKSVGRVSIINEFGIPVGTGSGFLVAPGLFLTNHHVLPELGYAERSYVLFDYEYDAEHSMKTTERFDLTADVFITDLVYDFTFVSISSTSRKGRSIDEYGYLPLIQQSGKALKGEPTSIIQHANGQPKQIAIRDSKILGRKRQFVYYVTDTNSGSSGGPVLSDDWFPVALHHRAVPDFRRARSFIANRGIRISSIFDRLDELAEVDDQAQLVLDIVKNRSALPTPSVDPGHGPGAFEEALKEVFHEVPYDNRNGYDEDFLGIAVPLPTVTVRDEVSRLRGSTDKIWIPYEHFSLVNFKNRKLALVTASNVDFDPAAQEPEPGHDYSRKALTGVTGAEGWFKDPRINFDEQLPDNFYNKDRTAFQKGHIVRRDAVAWGSTFNEVRRANGDSYHLTNCSPQVPSFNQHGIWAKLERLIGREGTDEKYCVSLALSFLEMIGFSTARTRIIVQLPSRFLQDIGKSLSPVTVVA